LLETPSAGPLVCRQDSACVRLTAAIYINYGYKLAQNAGALYKHVLGPNREDPGFIVDDQTGHVERECPLSSSAPSANTAIIYTT